MSMLILVIIGLIALIVFGALAYGKLRFFKVNVEGNCVDRGGECMTKKACLSYQGSPMFLGCPSDNEVCCTNSCTINGGNCLDKCDEEHFASNTFYCKGSGTKCCVSRKEIKGIS